MGGLLFGGKVENVLRSIYIQNIYNKPTLKRHRITIMETTAVEDYK